MIKHPPTQKYLRIAEIRENTVIMNDGSLRVVLLVSSINFALKNEDEQNALVGAYVNFLNNLDFSLQIVVQSRELNIDGYLELLQAREKVQTNELLKAQTAEYLSYIQELVSLGKIMHKRFYVVVPYNPVSDKRRGFLTRLGDILNPVSVIKMKENKFLRLRKELDNRVDNALAGLNSIGLNVVELDTQALIELFYNIYNPSSVSNQNLAKVEDLRLQNF